MKLNMTYKKVYVCQTNFFLARRYPSGQRRMLNIKNTLLQKVNDTQSDIWGVYSISMQFGAKTGNWSSIWVNWCHLRPTSVKMPYFDQKGPLFAPPPKAPVWVRRLTEIVLISSRIKVTPRMVGHLGCLVD